MLKEGKALREEVPVEEIILKEGLVLGEGDPRDKEVALEGEAVLKEGVHVEGIALGEGVLVDVVIPKEAVMLEGEGMLTEVVPEELALRVVVLAAGVILKERIVLEEGTML